MCQLLIENEGEGGSSCGVSSPQELADTLKLLVLSL